MGREGKRRVDNLYVKWCMHEISHMVSEFYKCLHTLNKKYFGNVLLSFDCNLIILHNVCMHENTPPRKKLIYLHC
jgi:hypothetical protein